MFPFNKIFKVKVSTSGPQNKGSDHYTLFTFKAARKRNDVAASSEPLASNSPT